MLRSFKKMSDVAGSTRALIVVNCHYYVLLRASNGTLFLSNGFTLFFWHKSLFTNTTMSSQQR